MKYLDFISILIPIILSIITFLYYWPLVIEYFDKQRSISYINSNKHKFFILLILITISTCLSILILSNVALILSWIAQIIVLIVFYYTINIKFNTIKRYIVGEGIDYEINKSNNVLLEEIYVNSSQINESLSEEIKMSTSDILKSSDESKESIIESLNTHSNNVKDVLSEEIKMSTSDILKSSDESKESIIESLNTHSNNVKDVLSEEIKMSTSDILKSSDESKESIIESLNTHSNNVKDVLSEEIKMSTSDILKSSERSKESIIESLNTHSNDVKDILSEKIKLSTSDIIKTSQKSIKDVLESIHTNSADVINNIDKFNSNNGVEFVKPNYNIFREMNKDLFEYHFLNNRLIKTPEDKLLFYNLICNRIKSDRKINLDIRINENKNILYYKREIALFLNNFFRIKELIDDVNVKNIEINTFFSSNFTINEGKIDFNINGFTRNLKK